MHGISGIFLKNNFVIYSFKCLYMYTMCFHFVHSSLSASNSSLDPPPWLLDAGITSSFPCFYIFSGDSFIIFQVLYVGIE